MSTHPLPTRRGGFSLVEVAIALAIFVFGALAIVQIFPPALGVIRNNESRVTATQLGETLLAQLQHKNSPPPEAIFDVDPTITDLNNPHKWQDYPAAVAGTVNKNASLPKSPIDADFNASALGRFRYIYGEPHVIGTGQTITLNFPHDTTTPSLANLEYFTEEIVEGVQITADGYLDFANAYLASNPSAPFRGATPSDPTVPASYRPPDDQRRNENVVYYVSYRWRECANAGCTSYNPVQGVVDEPLSIPNDAGSPPYSTSTSGRVLSCIINTNNKALPGGIQVKMRKTTSLSTISPTPLGTELERRINLIQNTGFVPIKAYFNYYASDWRNLSSWDAPVNNIVQLPISGVEPSSIFGILTNTNQTIVPTDLQAPDLGTNEKVKNAQKGTVEFPGTSATGARLKTVYRTLDNWAVQPSVAPRAYIPFHSRRVTDADFPHEPWREYVWSRVDPSNIYFHASDAGKTVAVAFNNAGTIVNATLTIGNIESAPTAGWWTADYNGFAPSGKVARATLTQPNGNDATAANAILSVQGLSIQARTAWQNADRYNQVIVPGYRTLM